MSIVFEMTPEVLFGAGRQRHEPDLSGGGAASDAGLETYLSVGVHTPPPGELALPRSSVN